MNRLYGFLLAWATGAALLPISAAAQVCQDAETVLGCYNRRVNEYGRQLREARTVRATPAVEAASKTEKKELEASATGPHLANEAARSAIRDFLPRFAGALVTDDPTGNVPAIDLRFNLHAGADSAHRSGSTLQAGVTLHQAKLFEPLVDSIPSSIRDASRARLEKELEDGDDATAFVALNFEGRDVGRSFGSHQELINRLARELVTAQVADTGEAAAARDRHLRIRRSISPDSLDPDRRFAPECAAQWSGIQLSTLQVQCLKESVRESLEAVLLPAVVFQARFDQGIIERMRRSGFGRLSALVNNQPQFILTAEHRSRVSAVGPSEWTGRARIEWGFYNMNGLRRHCRDPRRSNPDAKDGVGLTCLRSYADSVATPGRLARGSRVWIALEARYRPGYEVSLPEDSVVFELGSGMGYGVSAGYGRYLGSAEEEDGKRDRIDLHVSYDHSDGADLRQSRFLAGLFYTLRMSDKASGVVGLVWTNKPEFVGGADRRLGANLGLTYKLSRGKSSGGA
ncbi:MAG TPA: hypothetical protein VFQ45_09255 [Longimicrobium sp.]|nr:hypothetical protein [Longimicrobium sp.]